jgi:exosortase B
VVAVTRKRSAELKLNEMLREWWPVLLGLGVLYVPSYISLVQAVWRTDDQAHGPMVLAVVAWAFWQKRRALVEQTSKAMVLSGSFVFLVGLVCYVIGRSQDVLFLEVGSQIPVLTGLLLVLRGGQSVKALWFALLFIFFMVPIPSFILDALTGPLKRTVSEVVEYVLYWAAYPIARRGVVLSVGQYQLLVADACSGLSSIITLSAMGLLYVYVMRRQSWLRNAILLLAIWPTAFVANVVRVLVLVLITYHFGDEAGQGFLHGFAGVLLFVVGLLLLIGLDAVLEPFFKTNRTDGLVP